MTETLPDFRNEPIAVGDRVEPVSWGDGVPMHLACTRGTVTKVGRSRIYVQFDSITYPPGDMGHAAPSRHFRRWVSDREQLLQARARLAKD